MIWGHHILGMRFIHTQKPVLLSTFNRLISCSVHLYDLLDLFGGRWFEAILYVRLSIRTPVSPLQSYLLRSELADSLRPPYSWYALHSHAAQTTELHLRHRISSAALFISIISWICLVEDDLGHLILVCASWIGGITCTCAVQFHSRRFDLDLVTCSVHFCDLLDLSGKRWFEAILYWYALREYVK